MNKQEGNTVKRILCLLLVLLFIAFSAVAEPIYSAGTYSAEAPGFGGPVKLEVEVTEDSIASVVVTEHTETVQIGSLAVDLLPGIISESQTLADTVTGATFTSNAILRATEDALRQAGAGDDQIAALKENLPAAAAPEDCETDILVIGAGAAGMGAAITAADEGVPVILLEKMDITGGTTRLSDGCIWGVGSDTYAALQQEFPDYNWSYTAEDIAKHVREYSGGILRNPELLIRIAENSAYFLDYAVANGNAMMHYMTPSNQVNRPYWRTALTANSGHGVAEVLTNMVSERPIDLRLANRATHLLTDEDGNVIGCEVESAGGSYTIKAKKVILATGGIAYNDELMAQYCAGDYENSIKIASVSNTGDGQLMGVEVGGRIVGEGALGITCIGFDPSTNASLWNPFLHVNTKGEKIMRSDQYYPKVQEIINDQEGGEVYTIYGSDSYNTETLESFVARGLMKKADSVEELAEALGIDADGLVATLEKYNAAASAGIMDEFGSEPSTIKPVTQAPFYGCRRSACIMGTIPGLEVDTMLRVVREDGTPIGNLMPPVK